MRYRVCSAVLVGLFAIATASPVPAKATRGVGALTPAEESWKAVAASGPVQARPASDAEATWRAVSRGDELLPRTLVETGRKGRITLTRSSSLLILDPSSRVELPDGATGAVATSVVQTQGSVLYKVDSQSQRHFEVVTPYLVAGVKGTSFLVTVNDRYASVTVQHGRVEVTNPGTGEIMQLGPGDSVVRQREELEMDLVRDDRGSRTARKEARRLERMDRREPAGILTVDAALDRNLELVVDQIRQSEDATLLADSEEPDLFGATEDRGLFLDDELTRELIEEMVDEGIRDGAILDPADRNANGTKTSAPPAPPVEQP